MKYAIFIMFLLLLLVGCTLPPEPSAPGAAGQYYRAIGDWATDSTTFFLDGDDTIECSPGENVTLKYVVESDDYVYKTFYVWDENAQNWDSQTFNEPVIGTSNWIADRATWEVTGECSDLISGLDENNELFAVAYSCSVQSDNSFDCHNNKWQLEIVSVNESVPVATCTDSDGGKDYYFKGEIVATSAVICTETSGGGFSCGVGGRAFTDSCVDDRVLTEGFCDGTDDKKEEITCEYGCSNGACNEAPVLPNDPNAPGLNEPVEYVLGSVNAPVTMTAWMGFEDSFSRRFFNDNIELLVDEYISTNKVKLVFKHYPLDFQPNGKESAVAAECAGEQGEFWDYFEYLFEGNGTLYPELYQIIASNIALDMEQFNTCLNDSNTLNKVLANRQEGVNKEISGTPGFIINDVKILGAQPYSVFKTVIDGYLNVTNEYQELSLGNNYLQLNEPGILNVDTNEYVLEIVGAQSEGSIIVDVNGFRKTMVEGQLTTIGGLDVYIQDLFVTNNPTLEASANIVISSTAIDWQEGLVAPPKFYNPRIVLNGNAYVPSLESASKWCQLLSLNHGFNYSAGTGHIAGATPFVEDGRQWDGQNWVPWSGTYTRYYACS